MRSVVVTLALAAGVAIVAGARAPNFDPQRTEPLARAILDGVILGSTTWPSTPLDIQARLQLRPSGCDGGGRCASLEN
jgi:hypothetical protein